MHTFRLQLFSLTSVLIQGEGDLSSAVESFSRLFESSALITHWRLAKQNGVNQASAFKPLQVLVYIHFSSLRRSSRNFMCFIPSGR